MKPCSFTSARCLTMTCEHVAKPDLVVPTPAPSTPDTLRPDLDASLAEVALNWNAGRGREA
jgi:hypothetical protein